MSFRFGCTEGERELRSPSMIQLLLHSSYSIGIFCLLVFFFVIIIVTFHFLTESQSVQVRTLLKFSSDSKSTHTHIAQHYTIKVKSSNRRRRVSKKHTNKSRCIVCNAHAKRGRPQTKEIFKAIAGPLK